MGARSRKRGRTAAAPARKPDDAMQRGYARGRERDEEIRAGLEPIAPGDRPRVLTFSAVTCGVLAVANVVMFAAGVEVQGNEPALSGVLVFVALMFAMAYGMWRARYWAVLGFQALLALTVLVAGISLAVASNLAAVVLCVVVVAGGGTLFWRLIRVMGRIQMPDRP